MENKNVNHSPHLVAKTSTNGIMLDVIIALLPATLFGFIMFGPRAIGVVAVSVASAILCEYICCRIMKKQNSIGDLSAVVTGLLLGLNMPPSIPMWMPAIGSMVAIVVVKMMFGGLGQNFANPAIVGRIVLMVSFTKYMTAFDKPLAWLSNEDVVSAATPLADKTAEAPNLLNLFIGVKSGCIGEVSAVLLLLGGLYLVLRKVIKPTIPLAFIISVFAFSLCLGADPVRAILTGGVMLGAIFMATDYVTSPTTLIGGIIFGAGCGLITVIIRLFGSLPEGVSYSILIMNLLTPHIENLTRKKPFGWEETKNG